MNKIRFSEEEFSLLKSLIERKKIVVDVLQQNIDEYEVEIDDSNAELLSELVQEAYVGEGFDKDYKTTKRGKLFEGIIDKFYTIGW